MKTWVLHNRISPQAGPDAQDVLVQAEAVAAALRQLGHEVRIADCDLDLQDLTARLAVDRPELVFNLVESLGEHGRLIHLVPGLLDALGIAYAGCPAEAIMLTSHKLLAKGILRRAGLATPDWLVAGREAVGLARGGSRRPQERWIIKSIWEDASLGMDDDAVVDGDTDVVLRHLADRAGHPGAPWFAEAYIEGREFNLGLLEAPGSVELLPPAEMLFEDYPDHKPRIVGYAAKWEPESFEYGHTVRTFDLPLTDTPLLATLSRLARDCWTLLGLRGWARVDVRVDGHGRPWVLEVNANPCLSPDAGYAAALAQASLPFERAVERIVAVSRPPAPVAR